MTDHHASALAVAILLAAAPFAARAQHAAPASITTTAPRPPQKIARTGPNRTPPPVVKTAKAAPQSLRYLLSESP